MKWFNQLRERIFLYLLKGYIEKGEYGRLFILSEVEAGMSKEYNEQTLPGNVYNAFIEFILANRYVREKVIYKDDKNLKMMKKGIADAYDAALSYIDIEHFHRFL